MRVSIKYIGIPFSVGGRDVRGVDCYGLVHLFYRTEFLIKLPSYSDCYKDYTQVDVITPLMKHAEACDWIEVKVPGYGDVITFNIGGTQMHCGMALDKGRMLHCLANKNSCIERWANVMWQNRVAGFFRHVER